MRSNPRSQGGVEDLMALRLEFSPNLKGQPQANLSFLSSPQFRYRPKIGKIGPRECCWTTSFGVRPDKELCGLKPLYSSLNNRIFSFATSSERNQLTFRHSSRKLPLKDSMNGLSVGFRAVRSPASPGCHRPTCPTPSR